MWCLQGYRNYVFLKTVHFIRKLPFASFKFLMLSSVFFDVNIIILTSFHCVCEIFFSYPVVYLFFTSLCSWCIFHKRHIVEIFLPNKDFYPSQTNWFMLLTKGCFWFYMGHFMFSVVCLPMCLLIVSFCFFQNTHCYFYFLFILKVYIFCFIFYEVFYF